MKSLRLGKKTDALVTEAEQLHKQVDRYAYGPPTIRFTPADVDQARAAGVLIEFDSGPPIITDREAYRELCKQAIARTLADVKARVAKNGKAKRSAASKRERTPREELDVEYRANLREITRQAHGHEPRSGQCAADAAGQRRPREHGRRTLHGVPVAGQGRVAVRQQRRRLARDRRERAATRARGAPHDPSKLPAATSRTLSTNAAACASVGFRDDDGVPRIPGRLGLDPVRGDTFV